MQVLQQHPESTPPCRQVIYNFWLYLDREALLAFYDFPAEHWLHIRTTNPIAPRKSIFATVRLRIEKTKGSGSRTACLSMVFKLAESASKKWRSLNGSDLIPDVIAGVVFVDGVPTQIPERLAA